MFSFSMKGAFRRPVVVIWPLAFKFARNEHGRNSNLYEADLYRRTTEARRTMLCPVVWVSKRGRLLVMRAARPLSEMMTQDEYQEAFEAWDYMPGEEEGAGVDGACRANLCCPLYVDRSAKKCPFGLPVATFR
jgi:hypothetical protein